MPEDNVLHDQIATALTGVVKQIKAVRYYPPRHPALQAAAQECLRGFRPLLENDHHLTLKVRKDAFFFDENLVVKGNQVIDQLAMFCFARRIQYLTVLSDLSAKDLNHFVHYLNLDHQEIQKHGGIQQILEKAQVSTLWVNQQDLDAILEKKEEMEQDPEPPETDPMAVLAKGDAAAQQQTAENVADLARLIKRLEQEKDDARFRQALQELIPLLRLNLTEVNRPLVLKAFLLLCRNATGKKLSETRREHAMHALGQLATKELVDYLIDYMLEEESDEKTRQMLGKVIAFLREKAVKPLMERLANEQAAPRRKLLADTLKLCGDAAVPTLLENLFDDRWFVIRNSIAILGEIRSQEALPHLTPLLEHNEIRVRRETIRALTKIGGQRAINILLQATDSGDQELRRQALLSLGAIRAASAVPTLRKLLHQSGWSQKVMELKKDALKALGEIRSADAIPDLLRISRKKTLLRRTLNEELRVAAITALGEIGDEGPRDALEKILNDKSAPVARAAAQAIKQIDKVSI